MSYLQPFNRSCIMSSTTEKGLVPLRLLSCLMGICLFLLISFTLTLLQSSEKISMSNSVLNLMFINGTSINVRGGEFDTNSIGSETLPQQEIVDNRIACQISNSGKKKVGLVHHRPSARDSNHTPLKVYMYDLPPEFHFGLLGWRGSNKQHWPNVSNPNEIPRYPGGLNLQHSIEYWLTLDLLSSNSPVVVRPCSAIRVQDPSEADVIFVPFFSSLSYNKYSKVQEKEKVSVNRLLQDRLVEYLKGRSEWKRRGGEDHLIVAHHPNSMLAARRKLGSAMFVLADFGRYPLKIANLEKDVIAPYKHMVKTIPADSSLSFQERPILVYFKGAIYRKDGGAIRQELYYLLKDEKDVYFAFGSIKSNGVNQAGQGMASSKFCLNIAGDTPSSNRLFDAIASHCVPVIISDEIELPYEDVLDYSEFGIFVQASDAVKKGYLLKLLRGISQEQWTMMWGRLKKLTKHYEYQFPSQPDDAVDMIWKAVSRKVSSIQSSLQLKHHKRNRYQRTPIVKDQ